MPQWLVEITSADSELLVFLLNNQQASWYMIVEEDSNYYLRFSNVSHDMDIEDVELVTDGLLPILNGIIKHDLPSHSNLSRTGNVIVVNDNGHRETKTSKDISLLVKVRADLSQVANTQHPNFSEKLLIAVGDIQVRDALCHYANPTNWFNLYKVYKIISIDDKNNSYSLRLLKDNRAAKFTYSANNANASGDDARHSLAEFPTQSPKLKMSLGDAKKFIDELLTEWLGAKI